jgi:hypothetical protein
MSCVVVRETLSHPEVEGLDDEDAPAMSSVWSTILTLGLVPMVRVIAEDNGSTPTPSGIVCTWLIGPLKNSSWLGFIFLLATSPCRLDAFSRLSLGYYLHRDKAKEMHLFAGEISQ